MSASIDVEKILQKARDRQARVDRKSSDTSRQWSYDSSKEDAQNPWPDVEESPPGKKESPPGKKESPAAGKKESPTAGKKESPAGKKESPAGKKESPNRKTESATAAEEISPRGKRSFQSGKAGKQPLRTDSMQTEVETPPPKLKRANTDELTGSTSKKVKHALTRPQTVDKKTAIERKVSAEAAQKKLEQEFDDAEETQKDDPNEPAKARAAPSPSDDEPNEGSTARSSNDPMPEPKPAKSPKKRTKPESPAKPKPVATDNDEKEDEDPNEKKKKAHKLYMSRSTPSEIKSAFDQSKYCKHKMSSLYEDFLSVAGKWRNSVVYKTIKRTSRTGRRGIRRWLTRPQLENHFQDSAIVDAIIVRKQTDEYLKKTEIREHPDCPGPVGLIQYLVLIDEEHTDEDQDEITDMFRVEEQGSSSDDDDDDDDDDDEEDDGDKPKKGGKDR
ncbi:unnamed protein product [Symbiodinium sp. CCMP2592]|nr:unnamed protein product [Symbiodinium sp. CCMP2592]